MQYKSIIYETGNEFADIMGSGSTKTDVIRTTDFNEAFAAYIDGRKDYLRRYEKIVEEKCSSWNPHEEKFEEHLY